jgi:hypothetical protein
VGIDSGRLLLGASAKLAVALHSLVGSLHDPARASLEGGGPPLRAIGFWKPNSSSTAREGRPSSAERVKAPSRKCPCPDCPHVSRERRAGCRVCQVTRSTIYPPPLSSVSMRGGRHETRSVAPALRPLCRRTTAMTCPLNGTMAAGWLTLLYIMVYGRGFEAGSVTGAFVSPRPFYTPPLWEE